MTAIERKPYVTVREAIGDLPKPVTPGSDIGIYEWGDDDYYRDACGSGLFLPRTDFQREMHAEPDIPEPVGTAISLFSGCGGFDLGTTMSGCETRVFIEMDKAAVSAIIHNALAFGWTNAVIFDCDIRTLDVQQVLYAARLKKGECDLITGGFPCQPFSVSGKRKGRDDDRGNLFFECVRMIEGIAPKAFVLENVPGLLSSSKGKDVKAVCRGLAQTGYDFAVVRLNAADYGVPQDRMRLFFIGLRDLKAMPVVRSMIDGATHCDPDTGMPSFAPIWRWDGCELVQVNSPEPGQVVGSVNAARHRRERAGRRSEPTLFGDAG